MKDNQALQHALSSGFPVLPLFIYDRDILHDLPREDPRVSFIYEQTRNMHRSLRSSGSSLVVKHGQPISAWSEIIDDHQVAGVYINKDYEPYARERDERIEQFLRQRGIPLYRIKDQVIFEEDDIVKKDGDPYTVFTPYKRRWLERFTEEKIIPATSAAQGTFLPLDLSFPELTELGFSHSFVDVPPYDLSGLDQYASLRDYPAAQATSHLSPHLRFGTAGIREIISQLGPGHDTFLSELIWREFFMQILYHFPHVAHQNFNPKYNGIEWRNNEEEFSRWCSGETGYPMVDAGMRQLNETGTMHNRVRMVTASFLCKHLLIDWRWGEAYFAGKLLDFELSSNNGNWQWAAGTGCDAAPYFRIFNPHEQLKRFDKNLEYVRRWIPEYSENRYIKPVIDHKTARERAMQVYKRGIENYLPGI
jgi:deoxyribodipyrimidine photo-lyase